MAIFPDLTGRMARQVDALTDELRKVRIERDLARRDLNRAKDDLDGMHAANEALWREGCDKNLEIEHLRRELREARR